MRGHHSNHVCLASDLAPAGYVAHHNAQYKLAWQHRTWATQTMHLCWNVYSVVSVNRILRTTYARLRRWLCHSTAGPSTAPPARAGPQKRSLEELMNGGAVNGAEASTGFGSSAGTTSIGFGSSASAGTTSTGFGSSASGSSQIPPLRSSNTPWPPAPSLSKRPKTEFAEKSTNSNQAEQAQSAAATKTPAAKHALPAFLQPANVTATYGAQPAPSKN